MASTENLRNIQRLLWLYFWLLIFEGALRKWVVPQLAAPLLVIRDPVVIGVYFLALRKGIFPKDILTKIIIFLAFILSLGGLATVIAFDSNLIVALFGIRTNFLHLPLIFLIPKIFRLEDVKKLGKWVLLLSIPMAFLMVCQFNSPADAFINRTAGGLGEAQQIGSVAGKIRTPGLFSFTSGAAQYFSLVASFLLYGLVQSMTYPNWLLTSAGLSLVLALAVSGSRTALASVAIVVVSLLAVLLIRPRLATKTYRFLILGCIVGLVLSFLPSFSEGVDVLSARIETASAHEANSGGIVSRFFRGLLDPFIDSDQIPPLGYGLGVGTTAGAALVTGKSQFLLAEAEWGRIVLESGFVLGLLYILLRIGIVGWIGKLCVESASTGNALPLLLFGACAINILNGQIGQPTTLGFAVLGGGLCLASCRAEPHKHNQIHSAIR